MKENTKIILFYIGLGILFLLFIFHRWVGYCGYALLDVLLPDSLYLAFYLHMALLFLVAASLVWVAASILRSKDRRKAETIFGALFAGGLGIAGALIMSGPAYRDFELIKAGAYLTAECRVETLHIHRSSSGTRGGGGNLYYEISTLEKINNGRPLDIGMNFYHYRQLLRLQRAGNPETVTVYYLPNTKRVLKYTYTD